MTGSNAQGCGFSCSSGQLIGHLGMEWGPNQYLGSGRLREIQCGCGLSSKAVKNYPEPYPLLGCFPPRRLIQITPVSRCSKLWTAFSAHPKGNPFAKLYRHVDALTKARNAFSNDTNQSSWLCKLSSRVKSLDSTWFYELTTPVCGINQLVCKCAGNPRRFSFSHFYFHIYVSCVHCFVKPCSASLETCGSESIFF